MMSAMVPEGPDSGRSAAPPTMAISPPPLAGLGSRLKAGRSSGMVCELKCGSICAAELEVIRLKKETGERASAEAGGNIITATKKEKMPPAKARLENADFLAFS